MAVAALQRLLWLGRPDPFGQPIVHKIEWYLFHAVAYDLLEALRLVSVPALLLAVASLALRPGRAATALEKLARGLAVLLLVLTTAVAVLDQEVMRFIGVHLSLTALTTFGNATSAGEILQQIWLDEGGPLVNVALLLGATFGSAWAMLRVLRRPVAAIAGRRRLAGLALAALAAWLLVNVLWPGQFRAWRLLTPLDLVRQELAAQVPVGLDAAGWHEAVRGQQTRWLRANGQLPPDAGSVDGARQAAFPLADQPLFHASPWRRCQLVAGGLAVAPGPDCQADGDGDGTPLAQDCDDQDPRVHPGATDVPGDGVDQDCSDLDAAPRNVLFVILESHRAVNVGHVPGHVAASSPTLDRLASQGVAFARASANGVPTIAAFMALHTGLLPHPDTYVATGFATVRMRSLPEVLREHGYFTAFFSAADPAWDNQSIWLSRWYDLVDYDRSRETDAAMFAHLGRFLRDELPERTRRPDGAARPFLAVAMTKTNHFPFPREHGVPRTGDDSPRARIHDTMGYADGELGKLLAGIETEPWFADTLVVVTGDHGFPLGEHGPLRLYETAHTEATGVPLVFVGRHPELQRLGQGVRGEPASHVDVVPTLLDLLGIDGSGAWMGRSLVGGGEPEAVTLTHAQWALERGRHRALVAPAGRPGGVQVYDRVADPGEHQPLQGAEAAALGRALELDVTATARLMAELYRRDALWPRPPAASTP